MGDDDAWAMLGDRYDAAYASAKGYVRTFVLHEQLSAHLPAPPAAVVDVGGGAGHQPEPLVRALSVLVAPGGVLSVLALNAQTSAVRPALQRRWADALAAFDAPRWERGELGVETRGDTVDELSDLVRAHDVEPVAWYGVWLFSDGWVDLTGADQAELAELAAVELAASRRDPYRRLSRAFHLVGRKPS